MSYKIMAEIAASGSLWRRVTACAWQEQVTDHPGEWASASMWSLAVQPGWDDAWASAVAAENPDPGDDEAVITDEQILAAVQAIRPPA